MNKLIMLLVLSFTFSCGMANSQGGKEVVKIQTNAQCGQCKERIEEKLNYTSGVSYAELNLDNKVVEVKYNSAKITAEEIRKIISDLGYNADEVKADAEAQSNLPKCCQPGGHK
ncbi:MAG: heavy metal-associated domain-containing protein [Brumimicrobium sp.]|nr:heavy metal-associated domain-containing protein [Brumimicrobium sp.]